jgi:hypothetical protein
MDVRPIPGRSAWPTPIDQLKSHIPQATRRRLLLGRSVFLKKQPISNSGGDIDSLYDWAKSTSKPEPRPFAGGTPQGCSALSRS